MAYVAQTMQEIEKYGNYLLIAALILVPIWLAWKSTKAERKRKEAIDKTRREVTKNGKRFSVVTITRALVREKRTNRKAMVIERGAERDPVTVNGELTMFPRWIKVKYILKNGGCSKLSGWRSSDKFGILGSVDVDKYEEL